MTTSWRSASQTNGLHLDGAKRDKIKAVKKWISELGVEFNRNLNKDTTTTPSMTSMTSARNRVSIKLIWVNIRAGGNDRV